MHPVQGQVCWLVLADGLKPFTGLGLGWAITQLKSPSSNHPAQMVQPSRSGFSGSNLQFLALQFLDL
ncbi:hypothetical protein AMR42_10005 [Limnothrix sp. PR1529]|nr:hypothetical protein BCR12_09825 [Limnothrix sp. P13C2]PIB10888.1 hypothetical protein AMR42_10005 [Limnothrix sp. PR1529]